MYTFLIILILIAAVLLIGVVLIQKSKGGGLSSAFGGGNQIMGVRKTTDFVEKATWTLAITICVLSILSAFVAPSRVEMGPQIQPIQQKEQQATPFETQAEQAAPAAATPAPADSAK
ncbi:MAG: preprotein translocase subunit SecG [Muribaculaceae bacterium]|nr:preprotein translocase subunit SecG [Muribaculaceae bacterium]